MNLDDKIKGFPVDLYDIQLDSQKDSLKGKGTLYLNSNGFIELKLFLDTPRENSIKNFFESLNESNANAGKILSEDSYYSLKGISTNKDVYVCKRLLLGDHDNFKIYTGEVCSEIIIKHGNNSEEFKIAKVEIPYKIIIPKNHVIESEKKYSDKWTSKSVSLEIFEILIENQSIDIFSSSESTTILIQNENSGTIEMDIPLIISSLEFVTAIIIDRYAIEYENENGTKRAFRYFHKQRTEILKGRAPLWISSGMRDNFTDLFIKFYYFLQNHKKHESINQTLARIISSRYSYITLYALAVSTAIETIVMDYYSTGKKRNSQSELSIAITEIEKTSLSDTLKKRITGMLGSILGQEKADDIIFNMVNQGDLNQKFYDNWKKLRNSVNHGKDPDPDIQVYSDLCESNLVLYHILILRLIEYKGHYTDYSTYGHPLIKMSNE